eukprot:COSAG05_NODE_5660_length_1120_cov_2.023506_2_plen_47_part_00
MNKMFTTPGITVLLSVSQVGGLDLVKGLDLDKDLDMVKDLDFDSEA